MRTIVALAAAFLLSVEVVMGAGEMQSILANRTSQNGVALVSVAVGADGATAFTEAGTLSDGKPADEHTVFEIGSVTKTFTATILASMVLDGSVKLDDPVARYLPADVKVPTLGGKQITLLDLATQHSGLPRIPDNLNPRDADDPYADYRIEDMYAYLPNATLASEPATTYAYSNLGLGLLGVALANRERTDYATLLRTRVLEPLRMNDTTVALAGMRPGPLAPGFTADGDRAKPWTFQAIAGAGAIRSTAADMAKYLRCGLGIGPLAKACLFTHAPRATMPGNHIGLVWMTGDVTGIVHHGGDTAGFHAAVAFAPDRSRGIAILTNGGLSVDDVAMHAIDPTIAVVGIPKIVTLASKTLDQYVGTYVFGTELQMASFTIARVGDRLTAQLQGQPAARIFASETSDRFTYHVVAASLQFVRDRSRKIVAVRLSQDGVTHTARAPGASLPSDVAMPAPSFPPAVSLDDATLRSYVGRYANGDVVVTIAENTGGLTAQLTDQYAYPIFAASKDTFYYKIVDARITFDRDATGAITSLVLHQNGRDIRHARLAPR